MAFVNEVSEIPGESRTVDYERDAVLKGGAEEPGLVGPRQPNSRAFTLTWKGEQIQFGTRYVTELFEDGSGKKTWCVEKCVYPEHLQVRKREIIQLVLDAMQAFGVNFGKQDDVEIVVKINPGLGNLQMAPVHEEPSSPELSNRIH